jgi:hypothetical protein
MVRRQRRRRLTRQDQSREIADTPQSMNTGHRGEQWHKNPQLGATGVQQPYIRQGRMRSPIVHDGLDVPNHSVPELHDTRRNVVDVPSSSVHELYDTRHTAVDAPVSPVHQFYDARPEISGNPVHELHGSRP